MRPIRPVTAFVFAAAVAITGCTAHSTAVRPAAAPAVPVAAAPAVDPVAKPPTQATRPSNGETTPPRRPAVQHVLADGHYDAYIRTVDAGRNRLVVDLVQVFKGEAAVTAAIQDGTPRDTAQVMYLYIRNHNPRLRTLPLARDARLDLRGGCEGSHSHQLSMLAADARAMRGSDHVYYFTLTVRDGAVHRVQEFLTSPAC